MQEMGTKKMIPLYKLLWVILRVSRKTAKHTFGLFSGLPKSTSIHCQSLRVYVSIPSKSLILCLPATKRQL